MDEKFRIKERPDSKREKKQIIKISKHASEQIMTHNIGKEDRTLEDLTIPEEIRNSLPQNREERIKAISKILDTAMGDELPDEAYPGQIGFNITNKYERRILLGVLYKMTETNYRGTYHVPIEGAEASSKDPKATDPRLKRYRELGFDNLAIAKANLPYLPVVRLTPSELMEQSGFDPHSQADQVRVKKAIAVLQSRRGFCCWTRVKRDSKGKIIYDKNNRIDYEIATNTGPALNITTVLNKNSGNVEYYDITPHAIFLDQINQENGGGNYGYFIPIEKDWEQEIEAVTAKGKRSSPYIPIFLYWLRVKCRDIMLANIHRKVPLRYEKEISYEDLCEAINIPKSLARGQRKRVSGIIDKAIETALKLHYLNSSEGLVSGNGYLFSLNPDKLLTKRGYQGETEIEIEDQENIEEQKQPL